MFLALAPQAPAQQIITTAVSSGPNVIAVTTYQGDIYFATATPGAIYKLTSGTVTLIAGTPNGGPTYGTSATQTAIAPGVNGLAFDAAGNLYFTEPGNHQIRIVTAPVDSPAATIVTYQPVSFGSSAPGALALHNGTVYWADESLNTVFYIDQNGFQQPVAGTATYPFYPAIYSPGGYSGDGGPAAGAMLNHPRGLAFDAAGNLYIADAGNHVIRRVDTSGIITTIAGTGVAGFNGDGMAATSAQLFLPSGIVVDSGGNLFFADTSNNRVREIAAGTGLISTVAGDGVPAFAGDGGPATAASLAFPDAVALDASGNLLIGDAQNNRLRTISGTAISTLAGSTQPAYTGDGAPQGSSLNQPQYLARDSAGNIFFSDTLNFRVRRVDAATGAVTTVAGGSTPGSGGIGGPATSAELNCPAGIAFGTAGSLLIADSCSNLILQVAPSSSDGLVKGRSDEIMTVLAGAGQLPPAIDVSLAGPFVAPLTLAVDSKDTIYVGTIHDGISGGRIYSLDTTAGTASVVAPYPQAPLALTVDSADNLYIGAASSDWDPVDCWFPPNTTSTAALWSSFGLSGSTNEYVGGLAADAFGKLYASLSLTTNAVFQLTPPAGGFCSGPSPTVTLFAGNKIVGYSGDGGAPTSASLNQPTALAFDGAGNLFIADTGNNVLRKVGAPVVQPPPAAPALTAKPSNPANQSTAVFSFTDTDSTVTTFLCTLDATTNPCVSGVTYPNLADGLHTFSVVGQRSDGTQSTPTSYSWVVDTTPPPVPSIDSHPSDPSGTANAAFAFSDTEAGVTFTCSLDGVSSACSSPIVYPGLADGAHTFSVLATDAAGNHSAPNAFNWTIHTTPPPAPTINSAPAALSNQSLSTFTFSDSQAGVTLACQLDAGSFVPCASPTNYAGLPDGKHTFSVMANDPVSGRSSAPTTYSWTLDTTPPVVAIAGSLGVIVIPDPSVIHFGSGATDVAGYLCSLDGAAFSSCSSPLSLSITAVGTHTLVVQAEDLAGNIGPPDSITWTVGYCHCNRTGDYSSPAFNSTTSSAASPDGQFTVSVNNTNYPQINASIVRSDGSVVYSLQIPNIFYAGWQFSPDSSRFLYHYLIPGTGTDEIVLLDLTTSPPTVMLQTDITTGSDILMFSPSGAYFMLAASLGQSQTLIQIYRVVGVSTAVLVHSSQFTYFTGPLGQNSWGVAGWGFNKDPYGDPETAFMYAWSTGQNTFQWNVVNLATSKQVISQSSTAISAYWQFNPCGDVIAFVNQTSLYGEDVDLFSTQDGTHIGATSFPIQNVTLSTTTNHQQVATISSPQQTIVIAQDPTCGPNTPTGNNIAVTPLDAHSNTSPVTVTFSSVTQSGGTGVSTGSTGNTAPGGFQIGTPPIYYEIATSAAYSGPITICINYSGISFNGSPRLFHYVNGAWVDSTTSVDTTNHIICATVTSLSPFAIFSSSNQPPTANAGLPQIVEATSPAGALVTLSGSGTDPDADPVTFTWSEGGATLGTGAQIQVTLSLGLHTVTLTADDGRGGTATATVAITVQDTTPPAITIVSPAAGNLLLNQPVTTSYSCADAASGVATCAGPVSSGASLDTSAAGSFNFTVNAADNAGNKASRSVSYTVGYGICLQYDPTKAKQSGSTYPIKIQLCDAAGRNVSSSGIVVHAVSVTMASTNAPGVLDDAGNSNPDFDFRYDATFGGYIFNLQTTGYATGTFNLNFTAGSDPGTHSVPFQIK